MADDVLFKSDGTVAEIDKIKAAFDSLTKHVSSFASELDKNILTPLSDTVSSMGKLSKSVSSVGSGLDVAGASVSSAFSNFKKNSGFNDLEKMVKEFSRIGSLDTDGSFSKLSKSFEQLGSGLLSLSASKISSDTVNTNIEEVRKIVNSFKIVDDSKADLSKSHTFLDSAVKSMTAVGKAMSTFNSAVKSLPKDLDSIDAEKLSTKMNKVGEMISSLFKSMAELFSGRDVITYSGIFNKKENVKVVELAASSTLAMSKIIAQLKKLTPVVKELAGLTDYQARSLKSVLNNTATGLRNIFESIDGVFTGEDNRYGEGKSAGNKVVELSSSKVLALSKTIAQINKLVAVVNNLKGVTEQESKQIQDTLTAVGSGISLIFTKINGLFVGENNRYGKGKEAGNKIVELASSKTLALSKVITQLNKLTKTATSLSTFTDEQVKQVTAVIEATSNGITTLFTSINGLFSGKDVTTGSGEDVKHKVIELANSKTLALSKVITNIGNLTKQVNNVIQLSNDIGKFTDAIDKIQTSIGTLYDKLGGLFSGSYKEGTSKNGTTSYKLIEDSQSKTLAMSRITKNLKDLCNNVSQFGKNEQEITAANDLLTKIQEPIGNLFEGLSMLSESMTVKVTGKDGKSYDKIVETSSSMTRSMANVIKNLKGLAEATKNLSEVDPNEVLKKVDLFSGMVVNLVDAFAPLGDKTSIDGGKTATFIDKNMQGFANIMRAMQPFSSALKTLESVDMDTVDGKVPKTVESIKSLINGFAGLGDSAGKGVNKEFLNSIMNSFANVTPVVQKFAESVKSLSNTKLSGKDLTIMSMHIKAFISNVSQVTSTGAFQQFERLANAMDKVSNASKNLVTSTDKVDKSLKKVSGTARVSESDLNHITASFKQLFSALVGGSVIYTFINGFKSAIKVMTELEYRMRAVNTIARTSDEVLGKMTQQVMQMSSAWGVAKSDLTKALYDINSATIIGADAMVVLEASTKAARAGFTEVSKTADIISKIIKAYNYTAQDASYISDVLFTTVERGINPMEQLSQYMGRVLTGASNAGVAFEEVAASIATMTTRGLQTNIATTALNSMILKLAGNSKKLNALFQEYGYESSAMALRTLGLKKTMEILHTETGGATDALSKLGFNYRDIRAATILASDALSEYNKTMNMFAESANGASATERALLEVNETMQMKWDKLKESVSNYMIALQEVVASSETLKAVVSGLTSLVQYLTDAFKASWTEMTAGQAIAVSLTHALNGLLIIGALTTAFLGLKKALSGVSLGLTALIGLFAKKTVATNADTVATELNTQANIRNTASTVGMIAGFRKWIAGVKSSYNLAVFFTTLGTSAPTAIQKVVAALQTLKVALVATKVSAAAMVTTITAGVAILGGLAYAIYKVKKETEEFAKKNNISTDLGVQYKGRTPEQEALIKQRAPLVKAFKDSISGSTAEYQKARTDLLNFAQALDELIAKGKLTGIEYKKMGENIKTMVSQADKDPIRKMREGFEKFDAVVRKNEESIIGLINKIAEINKTPVGKTFRAFEDYSKFADAQAGMLDVVNRMESARKQFNDLNVMSDGKKVTIDNAKDFLSGKGQTNALSALNKHTEDIYTNLSGIIPDNFDVSAIEEAIKQLRANPQSSTDISRSLYKRKPYLDTLSKYGFSWSDQFGLSLKNKELQNRMGIKWNGALPIESVVKSLQNYKAVDLMKDERDLQASITKMTAEYKKHAEEFAKVLPKIIQEADKMAAGLVKAGSKSLTLPEQISNLQNQFKEVPQEFKDSINKISNMSSVAEAGQAMRDLINSTSKDKGKLVSLMNSIGIAIDLRKAQEQYKKALEGQSKNLKSSLEQMKVDRMADPAEYYRNKFESAYDNILGLAEAGKLDPESIDAFNKARGDYYNTLKDRVSYEEAPAMGRTRAVRTGSQEAVALLSTSVFAKTYKVDKDILASTRDVVAKTEQVRSLADRAVTALEKGNGMPAIVTN